MFKPEEFLAYGSQQYDEGFITGLLMGLILYQAVAIIFSL
jgi:hypothetical protein